MSTVALSYRSEIVDLLVSWRRSWAIAGVLAASALITATIVWQGGPPTGLTHLFYFVVIFVAVVWGPMSGAGTGLLSAILAEPVALALLGRLDELSPNAVARGCALVMVGIVCGHLTRSLQSRIRALEHHNLETILAFARAIDARDPLTARHSENVASHARDLAQALGLGNVDCHRIYLAGLLHDVGKLGLERSILNKPAALTDDEWAQVREHPVLSAQIVGCISSFAGLVPGARHHHERFDGRGYPDGLAGEEIPQDARVLAVADAYDAMTSDRSYRRGLSQREALERLTAGAGTQFDPECVAAFVALHAMAGESPGVDAKAVRAAA